MVASPKSISNVMRETAKQRRRLTGTAGCNNAIVRQSNRGSFLAQYRSRITFLVAITFFANVIAGIGAIGILIIAVTGAGRACITITVPAL
jgi:hypothetical protein